MQRRENLRHDQRGARTLNNARAKQLFDIARHAAQQRGGPKHATPHKQATAAKVIAQLAAGCRADGKGHAVEGDDQLQFSGGGV